MRQPTFIRAIAMCAVLVGVAPGAAVAVTEPATPEPSAVSDSAVDEANAFRQQFGLRADPGFVRGTVIDPNFSSEAFGVPLSVAEVAELFRRARIQSAMDDVLEVAGKHPDFAGAYLDQLQGGRPVLLFTRPATSLRPAIEKLLPGDADLQFEDATRTGQDLADLKRRVASERTWWKSEGVEILRVGVKTDRNTVRIGVRSLDPGVEGALRNAYGADVLVYETRVANSDVCEAWNNCRPMKGAIAINHTGGQAGECTAGFVVERTDNSALAILTAGHCIQAHGGFDQAGSTTRTDSVARSGKPGSRAVRARLTSDSSAL